MEIRIQRKYKKRDYTIGKLYIDGKPFCDTLEDEDKGLTQSMPPAQVRAQKVAGKTAIPTGRYCVDMGTTSPKFSKYPFYMQVCNGKLPRIQNVNGFDGVLIHVGARADNTEGCILVGRNKIKGELSDSMDTFKGLYRQMDEAQRRGECIWCEVV